DAQLAERLRSHPLPHWVERMTIGYLDSHKGVANRKRSWWDLTWPDGQEYRKAVFTTQEADRLTEATLLNLENSRVRGLALNLPQVTAGQPLPCITLKDLPANVSGCWGLFEIRLQAGVQQQTPLLRIPMVRRGYVSVFLSEEGKLFLPTARHIWEILQTSEAQVQDHLGSEQSIGVHERLQEAIEQAGQELFARLQQAHLSAIAQEEERGMVSFASRRKAIERVGLPEVRQFRLSRCNADESEWRHELRSAQKIVPEIRSLLMLHISKGDGQ
ncbi:MAG: helicase, partial [Nodosilinea sp.]